jgi:hypothetical protein
MLNTMVNTHANAIRFDDSVATQSTVDMSDLQAETAEVARFKDHLAGEEVISFKRKAGDARRGHPTRPILSRKLAVEHCAFMRDAIKENPIVDTIEYGDEIDGGTVTRFIACISPVIRTTLPTYDVVEFSNAGHRDFRTTKIQWSVPELEDLYVFAHTMGALDVCDMVIDRMHEELHCCQQRHVRMVNGTMKRFNVAGLTPALMNLLMKKDGKGFDFFASALITKAGDTVELLQTSGLGSWHQQVKRSLIDKLEAEETFETNKDDAAAIYSKHHHHQGLGKECYKSRVPIAPLVQVSNVSQQPTSTLFPYKEQPKPSRRKESPNSDRAKKCWTENLAFQKSERRANKARRRGQSALDNERVEGRPRKMHQERYADREEHMETSDSEHSSDDEDCNIATVRLPEVYSKARDAFRSSAGGHVTPYEYTQLPSESKQTIRAARERDGLKYRGKGMNRTKDTADMQRKKVPIVQGKLQIFCDYGYDPDSVEAPGRSLSVPGMAREDVEVSDSDEDDDED